MTESLRKLAESLEEAAPDSLLEREVLRNASTIKSTLEAKGEYVLKDEFGNAYLITTKNGHIHPEKSR